MVTAGESAQDGERMWRGMIASTRSVRLRGEDRIVKFERTALDDMERQLNEKFMPLNHEHLEFMPPIGRIDVATVRVAEDGESELHVSGSLLQNRVVFLEKDLFVLHHEIPKIDSLDLSVSVVYEPRNFEESVARSIEEELGQHAQPVERWAELPPLEFALFVPVIWGAAKFTGAFLEALGQAAGSALAEKISSWTRRSKQPNRTVVFAVKFQISDYSTICGYVLATQDEIQTAVDRALEASEELAVIAGLQKEKELLPAMKDAVFFLDEGQWHLGWWTDGETVFRTIWFESNPPDVDGVLSRDDDDSV